MKKINFGTWLKNYRKPLTLRQTALRLNISPTYLCDIENGNGFPPYPLTKVIAEKQNMSKEDIETMYDLLAIDKDTIPMDVIEKIKETNTANKIRKLLELDPNGEALEQLINGLQKQKQYKK